MASDGELIAAVSELISAMDAVEEYRSMRPFGILGTRPQAQELTAQLSKARSWVLNVLADRPTPVGTAPSPEYDPDQQTKRGQG